MNRLSCEMCGSTDLMKQDGVFVCQSCGTKYSVEEAKKMMVEGTVKVAGSVTVDNTASIENYLKIAKTAYSSQNQAEAENYANKVIEIAPDNYEAWLIKGKAAGWQSTLSNPRFPECISAFSTAFSNAPDDERDTVIKEIKEEISNISCALISLRADRFIKWPDAEESTGFISDITIILKTVTAFLVKGISISISDIMSPVAEMINKSVINAYKSTIYPDYKSEKYPYPDDSDFSKYIERIDYCIQLVEQSIKLCDDDSEADIQRYKNLIDLQEYAINACSYDWEYSPVRLNSSNASQFTSKGYNVDIYNNRIYFIKSRLANSAKSCRRRKISTYESKIREIEADKFWSKHSEERKALTQELRKTKEKRAELNKAKKSYIKVKLLDQRIAKINAILEEDRAPTSQLEQNEKDFIKNCELFWNNLSANDEYDEYVNNYPILKKADEYSLKRTALIEKKGEIENRKKERTKYNICKISFAFLALFSVVLLLFALFYLNSFLLILFCAALAGFCFLCVVAMRRKVNEISAEEIRQMEDQYRKELAHYNKIIDAMNAVPKYTGVVNSISVEIPEKINAPNFVYVKDHVEKIKSDKVGDHVEKIKFDKAGDHVFFGSYEQYNNISNGKEDIEWLVLEVRDGKALVVSKYALECKQYNSSDSDVTWETCTLREWLNNDFINSAFSDHERAMIATVTVSVDINPEYSTNPGNATRDRVFLLSITEANKYFSSDEARVCKPTNYAVAKGADINSITDLCFWWLRSPGECQGSAAYVDSDGEVVDDGNIVCEDIAVRPALWIDLNS